jgi:hypothetical protein
MKCVIAILLVLASSQVVYGQSKSAPASRDESHAQTTKKPDPEPPPSNAVVVVKQETSNTQGDGTKNDPKSYLARLFAPENLPNIALFFVGVIGIIVAICTLKIIARQTTAIEKQGEVMINSERAWIMVEIVPVPGMGEHISHGVVTSSTQVHTVVRVRILCRNEGNVPAWIIERRVGVMIASSPLPDAPEFNSIQTINSEPEPVPSGRDARPWDATPSCEGAEGDGQTIIVYGVVKYRDTFSEGHATTFGYSLRYKNSAVRLEGNPKYNKNT